MTALASRLHMPAAPAWTVLSGGGSGTLLPSKEVLGAARNIENAAFDYYFSALVETGSEDGREVILRN